MTRSFRVGARAFQGGSPVLDVPSMAVLQHYSIPDLLGRFAEQWGTPAEMVALPVAESDGLLFDVAGLGDVKYSRTTTGPGRPDFADVVSTLAEHEVDVVLTISPTLSFISSEELHLENILGSGAQALCIGNPRGREVVAAILGTGVDLALEAMRGSKSTLYGVGLNVTDLWPMAGSAGRIEPTCFCEHCRSYLDDVAPDIVKSLQTFPNALSLGLRASGPGISFNDEFGPRATPDEILGLARLRGYEAAFEGQTEAALLGHANDLLRYARARHDQTVAATADILDQALEGLEDQPRRILLLEGCRYSWTGGIWIEDLDKPIDSTADVPCDEFWLDTAKVGGILRRVPYRSYMWKRSRYYVSSFFDDVANACDPVARSTTGWGRYTSAEVRQRLASDYARLMGAGQTGQSALIGLPDLKEPGNSSERVGFVAAALPDGFGERFITGLDIAPSRADMMQVPAAAEGPPLAELLKLLGAEDQDGD